MSTLLKFLFFSFCIFLFQLTAFSQVQIGGDIDGEAAGDMSGYSVSMASKNTIAVGARENDGNGFNSGHTRVYKLIGNSWVQLGSDIDGVAASDWSGCFVSMPDTLTVAMGAPFHNGKGHARVFQWNGSAWVQKGTEIEGENFGDESGRTVVMPDANTIAIGAPLNDGNGSNSGHVRVFRWNGSGWVQKGSDLDGEANGDKSSYSISMPDSNTVAIGARYNDGNGFNSGHARVYRWTGTSWVQKGTDIDGENSGDEAGTSVSMPDPNTIAVGARRNSDNGYESGHVRIFKWNGSSWVQRGADIDGESSGDFSGRTSSMPDSNTVAIGARYNSGNGFRSGQVRVYKWDGTSWNQMGVDIDGEASGDQFGWIVDMPDPYTVASGALYNAGTGTDAGHARVFSFCSTTTNTIQANICSQYTSPSGKHTWTSSGTYLDTLTNIGGCDSIITIDLTINSNSSSMINAIACNRYFSPSGNHVWINSGTYQDIIPNDKGCDSIITINLTINNTTLATINPVVCDSFTSPSGKYTWTTNGSYIDTLQNIVGCDSLIGINLTVEPINTLISTSNDSLIAADTNATYQWLDCGNNYSPIPGATNRVFEPTVSGNYALALNKLNCADTSVCHNIVISSLKKATVQVDQIKIYPNPSNGLFTIDYSFANESKVYTVTDINGIVVREGVINKEKTQLDLSEFVSGIYLLRIEDAVVKLKLN